MLDKLLKGRYQIVEILTTGRFCQTYLAQDISLPDNYSCIVKHFISPSGEHPDGLASKQLFTREVETLLKLDKYDWVPQLLAHFEEDQQYYLVQEFIVGHSLSAELQPGQIWTENQVVELLQEVLSILGILHECGIIHRDINPSNLLRRHQDGRLIIIDFGWVKQLGMQVVTSQGQTYWKFTIGSPATIAIGTQGYMPAEQGQGRPRPNSDIYALGMIGIQALTGLPPTQLLADSDTGEIIWRPQLLVSPDLERVLTKMVRYHFKDRYQSVVEVMQALQPLATLLSTSTDSVQPSITATSQNEDQFKLNTTPVVQGDATKGGLPLKAGTATQLRNRKSNAVPSLSTALFGITILTSLVLMVGSYYSQRSPVPASQIPQNPIISSTANISLVKSLNGHSDSVWVVAFSPDGQTLVSGSQDQTIKLWDLDTGKLLQTFTGHTGAVWSVAQSAAGQLASGSSDNTIKLWDLDTGKLLQTFTGHTGAVWSVAQSTAGQLASGSSDNTIKLWDLDTGKLLRTFTGHTGAVRSIAFSADGLASGSSDNTIKLWNLNSGRQRTFLGHTNRVLAVALSPDGQLIASGSVDKTLKVWNLSSGKLLQNFSDNSHWVNAVAITYDGQIVAGAVGNIIKIWDLDTGELLHTLSGHSSDITSISFSANGRQLASASRDQIIKIWQLGS